MLTNRLYSGFYGMYVNRMGSTGSAGSPIRIGFTFLFLTVKDLNLGHGDELRIGYGLLWEGACLHQQIHIKGCILQLTLSSAAIRVWLLTEEIRYIFMKIFYLQLPDDQILMLWEQNTKRFKQIIAKFEFEINFSNILNFEQ